MMEPELPPAQSISFSDNPAQSHPPVFALDEGMAARQPGAPPSRHSAHAGSHESPHSSTTQEALDELIRATSSIESKMVRVHLKPEQDTGLITIVLIDAESNEVIKEIPPEELKNISKKIKKSIGVLFDQTR